VALAGLALTALVGFFHYIRVGRNETKERDEAAAAQDEKSHKDGEQRP
jgi:formate dehydrogenase iron-sulfur subunit